MLCEDLIFGLVAIYAVPSSKTQSWWQYPFNVPYGAELATITPAQLGFESVERMMAAVRPLATLLTNVEGHDTEGVKVEIFTEEKMSLQCKQKLVAAGLQWTNTVKATAIQPDNAYARAIASLIGEPHDLFLVGDGGQLFAVRSVENAYECQATKKLSEKAWTQEVQFTLVNCHGAQEVG